MKRSYIAIINKRSKLQVIAERTNNSLIKLKGLNLQLVYKIKDSNYKGLKLTSVYTWD